jgi:hypothetical protein
MFCEKNFGGYRLSLYRVHFKWKEKEVQLTARSLDLTHPYFVSIKDLVFSPEKTLIIDPTKDDLKKAFSDSNHIMIPLQSVILIEELTEEGASKVMPFSKADEKKRD